MRSWLIRAGLISIFCTMGCGPHRVVLDGVEHQVWPERVTVYWSAGYQNHGEGDQAETYEDPCSPFESLHKQLVGAGVEVQMGWWETMDCPGCDTGGQRVFVYLVDSRDVPLAEELGFIRGDFTPPATRPSCIRVFKGSAQGE